MRIVILGAGKMGSWLAKELARENAVAAYDVDGSKTAAITEAMALGSLAELPSFGPGLLINAVSLQNAVPAFEQAVKHLPADCVISDVASIKGALAAYYGKSGRRFASVHLMFGPTFAVMDNLREENAICIKESDPQVAGFFQRFFERLGVRVFEYTFDEHDRMMAYSLTTPFVASLVFAACMERGAVPGTTFARHRGIAQGLLSEDDHLLAEVLFNAHSLPQLEKITARLEFLKHVIKGREYDEAKRFFDKLRKNVG